MIRLDRQKSGLQNIANDIDFGLYRRGYGLLI